MFSFNMSSDSKKSPFGGPGLSTYHHAEYDGSKSIAEPWFRVIMSLILAGMAIYGALRLGFILSVDDIMKAYILQWRIELRNLEVSPDPASFGDSSNTTACIVSGPDDFINISFVLSITNNPSWLEVYISSVRVIEPNFEGIQLRARSPPLKGDGEVLIRQGIKAYDVIGAQYKRLWNLRNPRQDSALWLALSVRFSIFGYQIEDFTVRGYVIYCAPSRISDSERDSLYIDRWFGPINTFGREDAYLSIPIDRVATCFGL